MTRVVSPRDYGSSGHSSVPMQPFDFYVISYPHFLNKESEILRIQAVHPEALLGLRRSSMVLCPENSEKPSGPSS